MDEWIKKLQETKIQMGDHFYILSTALIVVIVFLYKETLDPPPLEPDAPNLKGEPGPTDVILCRFIAALFLHFLLLDEYEQGLKIMKYSLNHHWKFDSW